MRDMQAQRLHDGLSLLEIHHIVVINVLCIQLLCVNQLLNIAQSLLNICLRIYLRQLLLCLCAGFCRDRHSGLDLTDCRLKHGNCVINDIVHNMN